MKRSMLFACTGNSARSQMAEALLRSQASQCFEVYSAGTAPEPIDQRAIEALERFGVSIESLHSKSLEEFAEQRFDVVISLCDKAQLECQQVTQGREYLVWHFEDPKTRSGLKPFDTTLKEIDQRIKNICFSAL
jgi:ArsR family transcriptional regulator, arsenate/arsenite/antimonite-responsive transcriptional repressor / arsenate reductase (thioredoxin)